MPKIRWLSIFGAILFVTLARIAATYLIFSPTSDEPVHVAAGYDYLTEGEFFDSEHPPLARLFFSLPFIDVDPPETSDWIDRGNKILESDGNYMGNMAKARAGNLLFVAIALSGLALWTRQLFGQTFALLAVAPFALLPPILAHGGLATTDMAGTAALPVAMFCLERWLDSPSWWRTLFLGIAVGLGLATKFSFPLFFGLCGIATLIARRNLPLMKAISASAIAFAVVWAVYLFTFGTMADADSSSVDVARDLWNAPSIAEDVRLPAPLFFYGLMLVKQHDLLGHAPFLLGRSSQRGWWYFFPVVLAVKTPLPFLILAVIGAVLMVRRREHHEVVLMAVAILGAVMTSHINLGVRHVLPIYAPLSILAAYATVALWKTRHGKSVAAMFLTWLVLNSALAHPDYLPWMNALVTQHPERVLVESDLDWDRTSFDYAMHAANGTSRISAKRSSQLRTSKSSAYR